jgi:hypothetical protein
MGSIQKGLFDGLVHAFEPLSELFQPVGVQRTDWFGQIPKGRFLHQVQLWTFVIHNDPGKDGIPAWVLHSPTGDLLEEMLLLCIKKKPSLLVTYDMASMRMSYSGLPFSIWY